MIKSVNQKEFFEGDHTIYWPDRFESVVEYLKNGTANKENSNSLYKYNVHIIVLAACIGLKSGVKVHSLDKEKSKEIPISVFNNNDLTIFIYLIALLGSEELDINLLKDTAGEQRAVKIFEDYAAGGLEILNGRYENGFVDPPIVFMDDLIRDVFRDTGLGGALESLPPEEDLKIF